MKVTASEVEGSQVVLDMEIESERVDKAMERAYRRVVARVNIPGFRKGKAPRGMVERAVGRENLMTEALEILLPEAYQEAVEQTGIDPVDTPKMDVVSADPLSVRATVPVRPKVELGDYAAIRQSQEPVAITEDQVDTTMESIRDSKSQWVPVEREARVGDLLTIDIRARTEDKEIIDSQGIQVLLDPERPILAPGVVEQIAGMKAGDHKAFDATLPEEFSNKALAGKEAAIEVAVTDIKEKQVPELNDDLAKEVGEYTSVDELRVAVRKELEQQAEAQARRNLEESVVAAVVDQAKAEPPATWVEQQAKALRETAQQRMREQGLSEEQYLQLTGRTQEAYADELQSDAQKQLKRTLVLTSVADSEGISVSDEEVDATIDMASSGREGQVSPQQRERLRTNVRSVLREQKAISRLLEIAEGSAGTSELEGTGADETESEAKAAAPKQRGSKRKAENAGESEEAGVAAAQSEAGE